MEKNYNIDDHLRQSLKSISIQPANASFRVMMEKLEQKRKKRRVLILLYSGIGTLAAVVLAVCLLNAFDTSKQINPVAQINTSVSENEINKPLTINENKETKELTDEIGKRNERSEASGTDNAPTASAITPNSGANDEESQNKPVTNTIKEKRSEINNQTVFRQNTPSTSLAGNDPHVLKQSENKPLIEPATAENRISRERSAAVNANSENQVLDNETKVEDKINDEPIHQLVPVAYALPGSFLDTGLLETPINPLALDYAPGLMQNTNRFKFLLAVNFNPQFSRYFLSENKRNGSVTKSNVAQSVPENYLESKKEMNTPNFTYAYGIKAGLSIQDQWEVWLGAGFQRVRFNETLYQTTITGTNTITGGVAPTYQSVTVDAVGSMKLIYTYMYYSFEVKRIVHISPFLKLNYGAGVWFEKMAAVHLSSKSSSGTSGAFYDVAGQGMSSLANSGYRVDLKGGAIYDFGRRWQFRLNPGIFYSPTSVFNKSYAIKQKMYGLELEALLAFKLYRD